MKIRNLSVADVLFIHSALIEETGGSHGVRDLGLLDSAVRQIEQSFGGRDLYPTLYEKSAALFIGLLKNHPFIDGNKRTAISSLGIFLELNGVAVKASQEELSNWVQSCAAGPADPAGVISWIKAHTKSRKV